MEGRVEHNVFVHMNRHHEVIRKEPLWKSMENT